MGRLVEFDYDKAIDRATRLFWKKGYIGTSLRDLLKTMKIGEGSFYNTLKSKRHLYLECLEHYNNTVGKRRLDALFSKPTARESVSAFFKTVLDDLDDARTPQLCLLSGSLAYEILDEKELREYVVREIKTFVSYFERRLSQARDAGELPSEIDVDATAAVIVNYLTGLFRTVRTLYDRPQIEKQISQLISALSL